MICENITFDIPVSFAKLSQSGLDLVMKGNNQVLTLVYDFISSSFLIQI